MSRNEIELPPLGRQDSGLGSLLIVFATIAVFFVYLKAPLSLVTPEIDWLVRVADAGARTHGGASHPLLFVLDYLIVLFGKRGIEILPRDILEVTYKIVAAIGVGFFGGYVLQRFSSVLLAIGGMVLLGFSFVFWRGAITLNAHLFGLSAFLGALCCVADPAYGNSMIRLRDFVAMVFALVAVLCSQFFIILMPAFFFAASERWSLRAKVATHFFVWYGVATVAFVVFYLAGPSTLFKATTLRGKIVEWVRFQPTEASRLMLDASTEATAQPALHKIERVATTSILAFVAEDLPLTFIFGAWFAIGITILAIFALDSIRKDAVLALLVIVPSLASIYLADTVEIDRYLPVALGFCILVTALLGYFELGSPFVLRVFAALLLLGVLAPSVALVNYHRLHEASVLNGPDRVVIP